MRSIVPNARSETNTSHSPFRVARDEGVRAVSNATQLPSPEIAGLMQSEFASVPSAAMLTRTVVRGPVAE